MTTLNAFLTPAHIAGMIAVLIGAVDAWAFHASFGLLWDQGLIVTGLGFFAGVSFATVSPIVAANRAP